MDISVLADQLKLTITSSVWSLHVVRRTPQEWLPKGTDGKRESRKSLLSTRFADDSDIDEDDEESIVESG